MPLPFIPQQIKIGNRNVKVNFVPETIINDEVVMGYYNPEEPAIYIRAAMSPLDTVETFWHELMHAIFDYTRFNVDVQRELNDSDSDAEDAWKIEESSAENFAKVFLQVIQDNDIANITTQ